MVRPSQLLYPQREPVTTRPAATVLLLRDGPDGVEVLMTRRSMTASFAPGAYVFPGGGIDAADAAAHAQSTRRATQSDLHLTQAIAAIRESFEELGVLLARHADGSYATTADIAALDRKAPFAAQCRERGLVRRPGEKILAREAPSSLPVSLFSGVSLLSGLMVLVDMATLRCSGTAFEMVDQDGQ